ncbi:MAG: HYR domain-containing protein [Saprospiraceae bacterium]|nr:HYR domain-containing protein [Saprospiraceae bacterium]
MQQFMPASIGKMLSVFFVSLLLGINIFAQCPSVQAYSGSSPTGNQSYNERLGMVFTVTAPITVTHLGAYDDGQDGLALPITVGIVRRSDGFVFAGPITLSGSADPLSGLHRIQSIPDVVLPNGQYVIVAVGYGAGEQNGNSNIGGHPVSSVNAGGNLTFDEALFFGGTTFGLPTTSFPTPNVFHAGTFLFSEIPVAPQLEANPDESVVCAGDVITVDISTPGENGQGICIDEYRFSVDNGVNWSAWTTTVPAFFAVGGSTNIIESRRNCDSGACLSDTFSVSWLVTSPITSLSITAVPDGDVCIGATNVQYNAIVTGGTGPFSYLWCAYDNGTGALPCFNNFNNNSIQNPIRTWNTTTGFKSVGVTVSQDGCPDVQSLYVFEVTSDPVRPALDMATPGTGTVVCQGSTVSATFLAGTGGAGNCVDEFRYSIDNGSSWNAYIPGNDITVGSMTVLLQSRRVCDGLGCDGAGETFQNVFSWPVSLNPTADISPDPAEVCAGIDLQLNGNPSGGSGIYSSHAWYGTGYEYLNDDEILNPIFNHDVPGQYEELIYRVTDNLGCSANDTITVTIFENPTASILPATIPDFICPGKNLLLNGNPSGGDGNYTHQWEDASNFNDATLQSAVFNSLVLGDYTVTYTVTDGNGCTGTDDISFTVGDEVDPVITCPANVTVDTDPGICTALFEYEVIFSDNCSGLDVVGFENEFAPGNWTLSNSNAGDGDVDESLAPSSITITGSNTVVNPGGNNTDYCITVPGSTSGEITFDWSYTTSDADGSFWDRFGYVVDGIFTQLSDNAGPNNQMGSVTIPLSPDQEFCFRIFSVDQVAGAAVTITMNFGYMENINPMLSQTDGLVSGSDFPLGTTINTFEVTDFAGNTNSCTFTVLVEDNENPVITCPDDIVIELDPLECGRIVEFAADATDNCSIAEIRQIEGLASGSFFPIGTQTISFVAEDGSGNTDSCSFIVRLIDFPHPPLGCIPINLSLDEDCSGTLTPENVLTGYLDTNGDILLGCLDCFVINVTAPNGTPLGATVTGEYLGKTLNYMISNTKSGFNCWNTVLIEDKIAPTIECRNDTISCMEPLSAALLPIPSDNCYARLVKLDERFEKLDCDPVAIARYVRTWKAVDDYGNESGTCNDTVYLKRTDLSGLVFPGNETLSCSEGYATDSKGFPYPAPSVTGVPTLNGLNLYPFDQAFICNGALTYKDQLVVNTPCKKQIVRTWSITEWWCSTTVIYNMPFQIIDIVDTIAPVIPQLIDITVTTQTKSCDALVSFPTLNITDNCNELKLVNINASLDGSPSGFVNSNGGSLKLTVGKHRITYTALDVCGKLSEMSYYVTVQDDTSPIAICDQLNVISLNSNGYAQATALAVDDGSFDECGGVTLELQRMEDPCGTGQDTTWLPYVEFCCEDANQTRMVILRVTDKGYNTNMCMVSVKVQDKIPPVMTCPGDLTISDCLYTFDPNFPNSYFGAPTAEDNCPSNINFRQTVTDGRSNCGTGDVIRTITLLEGGIVYGSCTQIISFQNNEPFDGYNPDHVIWPKKDTTINGACSPLDLRPEFLGVGHGFPVISEDACDP